MDSRKRKIAAIFTIVKIIKRRRNRRRRVRKTWVKNWIERRSQFGLFHNVFEELAIEDPLQLRNFLRMSAAEMEILLGKIGPIISKRNTNMRESISAKERLVITLRFLASGDSYHSLMYSFRIPVCTISLIVPEVCGVIYQELKTEYLQIPTTNDGWEAIAQRFEEKWNFPHCIGALDGKHVVMQAPKNSGSLYYNYKGTHSIVLMAVVDASYRFIYCNIGCNGRVADGGVFNNCSLAASLERNQLSLPAPCPLPGRTENTPYVFVADDAFALKPNLMKPFPHKNMPPLSRVFNYRLSRARRVVENAFGIMANRFRVLRAPMNLSPAGVVKVTSAVCVLHNYLLTNSTYYSEVGDIEDAEHNIVNSVWREEGFPNSSLLPLPFEVGRNPTFAAKAIRDEFKEYFVSSEGEVSWQYKFI